MIVHLDADAFFASVEQAADPRLRGKPVAVGGSKRGIIASASYEARKFGVFTPMPTARALKICPRLIIVPGDFEKYELFSRMMFSYAYDFTPEVEVQGIDEGYFDAGSNRKLSASAIATAVRKAVHDTLKITVSEGVGANKLVSQIASKLHKPDHLTEVPRGHEEAFLAPLTNTWLPGIGPKAGRILDAAGLTTIGRISRATPDQLALIVGASAPQLWRFARGIDERPVIPEPPAAKSYGEQEPFEQDQTDEGFIQAKLHSLADRLMAKVRADGKMIRTIGVRIRYNDMEEEQRSSSLQEPTSYEGDIYQVLKVLLKKAWTRRVSLRLVAVKFSHVYQALFEDELHLDNALDQGRKLDLCVAVDRIREEFGSKAILRGHDLLLNQARPVYRYPRPRKSSLPPATALLPALLNCKSHYSFLDSLLSPGDAVALAARQGARAIALTDPNLHGCVELIQAAKQAGLRPIIAAELRPVGGAPLNAYVRDAGGYTNLCHLLSLEKLTPRDVQEAQEGLILLPAGSCGPQIRYSSPGDRKIYRVLQSIRTLTLLDDPHPEKQRGEFHCLPPQEFPGARQVLDQCHFELEMGGLRFPHYRPPDGSKPADFLCHLALEGARRRYGSQFSQWVPQLNEELGIIADVGYEEYFLLTWDLLQKCREKGISWITRGSAADSLVCYCLGISGVCPVRFQLYFKRFLNRDRMALNKLPDIDIDFPHDRRDEVVEMLLARYGSHAAIVGGFNTYQGRSAVADIAKTLGVSEFQVRRLTEHFPRTSASNIARAVSDSVECRDWASSDDPCQTAIAMAHRLDGLPRHPKMHPCGVVLSREPIHTLTPTFVSGKGWPTTHFDMDAVEAIGLVKMDILAQAGLSVMRDTVEILSSKGVSVDLESLGSWEDPAIWDMIARGESRGVHHIESPAMLTLARMCGVRKIDDLVAIVSVIRPGAANSLKKAQFARRCRGQEAPEFAHASLEPVLRSTYGVVAYEEHILQIGEAFAGLSPGRGDILRRALVKEQQDKIEEMRLEFGRAARAFGRSEEEIAVVWELLHRFQGYAFCRAHSTAYAVEAYQAAHLKLRWPREFLACVLEHGKGFYSRLVYSLEARRLGIGFLGPDVNSPHQSYYPEPEGIRVPLKQIKGLTGQTMEKIARERSRSAFRSVEDFVHRCQPAADEMQGLLEVGAFDCIAPSRTAQFWAWRRMAQWPSEKGQGLLFGNGGNTPLTLPTERVEPTPLDTLRAEMDLLGFTVSGHPLDLHPQVAWDTYAPIAQLHRWVGETVIVAGLIIESRVHLQTDGRPMKFVSVCDPTGIIEVEIFAEAYARWGLETIRHPVVAIVGIVTALEGGEGHTLDASAVGAPRLRKA